MMFHFLRLNASDQPHCRSMYLTLYNVLDVQCIKCDATSDDQCTKRCIAVIPSCHISHVCTAIEGNSVMMLFPAFPFMIPIIVCLISLCTVCSFSTLILLVGSFDL